jgi:transposase
MKALTPCCAGLDVHQKSIVVCVVSGEADQEPEMETRTFSTMTKDLFEVLRWLEEKGVTHIALESTGIYWKPVYNILEGYFEITLANAQRIKNVPGRKTDVSDAEWIATLLRHGLIEASFVPPEEIRQLRDLTRRRKKVVQTLTSEKNRIQKALESSNIKLGTVISDIFGVSGRNLLERLMEQGYVEEKEISACVKGTVKNKVAQLNDSLFGTLNDHQIFMIRHAWKHIVYLEESMQELDEQIDLILQNYQEEVKIIQTMPGIQKTTAAAILAEIGADMNVFPSAAHLSSWAGLSPGNHESAGKKKGTRTVQGNPHIKSALCEAAWTITRSRKTWLATKFWKLSARIGKKKAVVAIAHKMLISLYYMLRLRQSYAAPAA